MRMVRTIRTMSYADVVRGVRPMYDVVRLTYDVVGIESHARAQRNSILHRGVRIAFTGSQLTHQPQAQQR